jgi:hypothetical protein
MVLKLTKCQESYNTMRSFKIFPLAFIIPGPDLNVV